MPEAAVKGAIFKGVADDLARLRAEGRTSEAQMEAHLDGQDIELLETEISASLWYPMASYGRIMTFLGKLEGEGKDAYFVERGRSSARRLMDAGLYQQLAFLERWHEEAKDDATDDFFVQSYMSKLKLVNSLSSSIYNVGVWGVERDPDHPMRVLTIVTEATAYTEPMRLAAEGFLNECARAARSELSHLYTSERVATDRFIFRMTRDITRLFS